MIYLDNAATTRVSPAVASEMLPYLSDQFGNPGALYSVGRNAKQAVERARAQVASLIGAEPEQIVFTSGGTESNNMVFRTTYPYLRRHNRVHLIVSAIEHDSVLRTVTKMFNDGIVTVSLAVPNKSGVIDPRAVDDEFYDETGLVSVMMVNNETGAENDVREIARLCRERGALFHTDCVQAASCCTIDVKKIGCDFLSLSSHKIHGPKGVGALYIADKTHVSPMIFGGLSQEFGLRGGTENVPGIVGFGAACELLRDTLHESVIHTSVLKQLFVSYLSKHLEQRGLSGIMHINGETQVHPGKIVNLRFDGVDGETLLLMLDSKGVCVSAGSACRSHESQPSHVLLAMGVSEENARNSIRVSFAADNTEDEVKAAAQIAADCIGALYRGN